MTYGEIAALAWVGVLIVAGLAVMVAGAVATRREGSPPGWVAQGLVTVTVLLAVSLAGLGVAKFFELVTLSSGALAALIPLSLSPWLAYKAYKHKQGGSETEVSSE